MVLSSDTWNPKQYDRFKRERQEAFMDLMALVRAAPHMRVVDLGCGTGEMTVRLHEELQAAETLGLDSSPAMLARAEQLGRVGLTFERGDISEFVGDSDFDLVVSNAALHWVHDHEGLLQRFFRALRPGGQIAIQMPANQGEPSHVIAREIAAEPPFDRLLVGNEPQSGVLPLEEYARLLHRIGFAQQHVHLKVFGHVLSSREEVIEWMRGALFTFYQQRMPADLFLQFVDRYRERLFAKIDDTRPCFFPFRRIYLWARK